MKILIAYYSRTSTTAKVAKKIQVSLNCDMEEIIDKTDRSGFIGYIKSCYTAMRETTAKIEPIKKDPSEYDLVIIGTPVWAATMANPVLTYIKENKTKFNNVSFFCTCGGSGYDKTFAKMEDFSNKTPLNTLYLTQTEIKSSFDSKIEDFTEKIEK